MISTVLVWVVGLYQRWWPWRGACRFYPTCSCYARAVLQQHRFMPACWYILLRLIRCGPWSRGGYDPPPTPGWPKTRAHRAHASACQKEEVL